MSYKYNDPYLGTPINVNKVTNEDKVTYDVREKLVKTGETEYDFVTEQEVYVKEKVSLDKYIQSFAGDVGLENILKRVALTGDTSLLNEKQPLYGDIRNMPENNMERDDAIKQGLAAAKKLGITDLTEEGLRKYIKDEVFRIEKEKAATAAAEEAVKKGKEGE